MKGEQWCAIGSVTKVAHLQPVAIQGHVKLIIAIVTSRAAELGGSYARIGDEPDNRGLNAATAWSCRTPDSACDGVGLLVAANEPARGIGSFQ